MKSNSLIKLPKKLPGHMYHEYPKSRLPTYKRRTASRYGLSFGSGEDAQSGAEAIELFSLNDELVKTWIWKAT